MLIATSFVISIILSSASSKNEVYKGSKVYNIKFTSETQQEKLYKIKNDLTDFWRKPNYKNNVNGLVMVLSTEQAWFEKKMEEIEVDRNVVIEDVFEYLKVKEKSSVTRNSGARAFGYDGYYRYDEILEYLNEKAENSTSIEVIQYGQTSQGRPLSYIKIATNPNIVKPVIFIEAGIIPREWITISSAIHVIDQLLENDQGLLDAFDWIVIPVANPDGYEYTHTDLRLWTKSLSTDSNLGSICPGVNINRNFDVDFLNFDSSSSPCSHLYSGPNPYSEIETRFIRDLVTEYQDNIQLYISLQSSGGFVAYPWSYENAASGMFVQHHRLGFQMVEALNYSNYLVGPSSTIFGERISGTSCDFVQQSGVLYSLILDIMPNTETDVLLPESEISGVVEDVWRAIAVAARNFS